MDQRLIEAAEGGDAEALYALLKEDPYILDKVDKIPITNTPLHLAASAGHTSFVGEIANLKPSFCLKLNQDDGFSPLHLASKDGHLEVVKILLKVDDGKCLEKMKKILAVDGDLCNLKGKGRITPLHCASMGGNVDVLKELLSHCPKSLMDLTLREETALHLALKYDHFEVFNELVNWLRRHWQHDLLSWQDQEGNTVLHLAVLRGHNQLLLHHCRPVVRKTVQVNSKNKNRKTVLDLLLDQVPTGQN